MKWARESVAAVLMALVMASPAPAAEIRSIHGEMLVNSGAGYRLVEGPMRLSAGDAAIAAPRALGRLTYEDGCIVDVVPGAVAWVSSQSPCAAAAGAHSSRDPGPTLTPRDVFDSKWLREGAAMIDPRKPPAGP